MARSILASLSALGDLPQDAVNLTRDTINNAANYWSKDNAQFEKTNPGLGSRLVRAVNPMTSLGSAMGSMQDAAGQGSIRDMGLSLLQALPAMGATRPIVKGVTMAQDVGSTVGKTLFGGVLSGAVDQAQAGGSEGINPKTSLNFEQRVLNPSKYPVINNEDGSYSTHRMSYGETDGKYVAFPTIIQDKAGKLQQLEGMDAFDYAMKNNEYREFTSEAEASAYAEGGYKKSWGAGEKKGKR